MVPKGWRKTILKELLDGPIKNGYSPVAADRETGYWVLSLGALGGEAINASEVKPVLPEDKVLQSQLKSGDFLVSRSNTPDKVGRSIYFRGEIESCSYPDLMMKFRVDESKARALFIEQLLKSSSVRSYFKSCAAGSSSTMVKINKGVLEKTPLLVPNINEQKKITQILSTWDKAIGTTEQLLANSRQQKKALMQQLLTGKKRLLDKNGVRFSGEWKSSNLDKICSFSKGYTYKSSEYSDEPTDFSFLTLKSILRGGGYSASGIKFLTNSVDRKFSVTTGDLIFAVTDLTRNAEVVGAPILVPPLPYSKSYISMDLMKLTPDQSLDKRFFFYLLTLRENRNFMRSRASGSTVLHLNIKGAKRLIVRFPTLEEQQKIAQTLSIADKEIETLQQKLDCLKQEKKALMQQLLTGKRRVVVEAAA